MFPTNVAAHPFVGLDLALLLEMQATAQADKPFLRWTPFAGPQRTISYLEFLDAVRRVAAGLAHRGVTKQDKVLIHLENCPEGIISWFACAWLGATAVLTNARAAPAELDYFAEHSGAVAAITQPKLLKSISACRQFKWIAVTETDNGEAVSDESRPSRSMSFESLASGEDVLPRREPEPFLPVGIQYTSGTTSRPKAVVMTHANALWGGKIGAAHAGLVPSDVFMVHLPLYHVIALSYGLLASLWTGGTVVLAPRFSASRFWPLSIEHSCTWAAMVPFCVKALEEQPIPDKHFYRSWGNAFWSSRLERRFGTSILGWWGMTEIVTQGIVGDPGKAGHELAIGRPAPEYNLEVRDDAGNPISAGETGHLFIEGRRGISIFAEYLHDKKATEDSFDERGFFKTGDMVTLHRDGFIQFSDRSKDMLKVGGENVSASEVERVIQSAPGVREVAVVGKSDFMLGEVPVAFVMTTTSDLVACEEAIYALCEKSLAPFKRPQAIHFLDDLPRGLTDKVSKNALRELARG